LNSIAQVTTSASMSIDRPGLMAQAAGIIIILNLIASIILVRWFGFYGVAWGTLVSVNLGTTYFFFRLHSILRISLIRFTRMIIPFFLAGILAASSTYGVNLLAALLRLSVDRVTALQLLIVEFILFFLIYMVVVLYARLFNAADFDFFAQKFSFLSGLIPRSFREYDKR
jgi:hypothetical protein